MRTLEITSGSVSVADSPVRRSCSVTLADEDGDLVPDELSDLVAPGGNEIRLWRGIPGELVPLGVFRITDSDVSDSGESLTIKVKGQDRARTVQRARFEDVYTVASGTNYATAIKDLIDSRVSGLTYSFMVTSRTTPALTFDAGSDPWEAARKMAASLGAWLYFSPAGVCTLEPIPDPETQPIVATYAEGDEATILAVNKSITEDHTYSVAVVSGENVGVGAPPRATAEDDDPQSPTYVGGSFGRVPIFLKSKFITSAAQAQDVADALLLRAKGASEVVSLQVIPNPAHNIGDVISVKRTRAGVNSRYVIDGLTIPMQAAGAMQVKTRKQRIST